VVRKKICESTTDIEGRHRLLCLHRHAGKRVEFLRVIRHLKDIEPDETNSGQE
jgi:hypothetical protein